MTTATESATRLCKKHFLPTEQCAECGSELRRKRDELIRRRNAVVIPPAPEPAKPLDPSTLPLWQVVLLAADSLGEEFGRTALVVAAWKLDPKRLGLEGLEKDLADSKHILQWLYGPLGLLTRGLLQRMSAKTYMVTQEGRREVARLKRQTAARLRGE